MDPHPTKLHRLTHSTPFRIGLVTLVVLLIGAAVSRIDFHRDLHHFRVGMLSGAKGGAYYGLTEKLNTLAAKQRGKITNLPSQGSLDNLAQLAAGPGKGCPAQFALMQNGMDWPEGADLALIGRLPRPEAILLLGKNARRITHLSQMAGMKIGIGPAGSGTSRLAHQIFDHKDLAPLKVVLSEHDIAEQLDLAAKGELDLAMMVMGEDAELVRKGIRELGLEILSVPENEVISRRIPFLHASTIPAGTWDPIGLLPPTDRAILRVDTLVVANSCAGRSQVVGLLALLSQQYPEFIRVNRDASNETGLKLDSTARSFYEHQGPELADQYAPWLVDVMPPGNWAYLVAGVSILFNIMGAGHRFRLWRIDVDRVKIERDLTALFGPTFTLGDIARLQPDSRMRAPAMLEEIRKIVHRFETLAARSRRQSVSPIVPMGQEMGYRYQESVIHQTLATLRAFLDRCEQLEKRAA